MHGKICDQRVVIQLDRRFNEIAMSGVSPAIVPHQSRLRTQRDWCGLSGEVREPWLLLTGRDASQTCLFDSVMVEIVVAQHKVNWFRNGVGHFFQKDHNGGGFGQITTNGKRVGARRGERFVQLAAPVGVHEIQMQVGRPG